MKEFEDEMLEAMMCENKLDYIKNKIKSLESLDKEHDQLEGMLKLKVEIAEYNRDDIEILLLFAKETLSLSRTSISAIKKEILSLKKTAHGDTELKWDMTETGELQKTLANVCNFLIVKGINQIITYNKFNGDIEFLQDPPWQVGRRTSKLFDETDLILCRSYMSNVCRFDVKKEMISDAMEAIAYQNQIHPVRSYLNSLTWDGVKRIETFLHDYTGCVDNDYTREVGVKFLCACVLRVFNPGCKFDYILVLEGSQGIYKSTFVETLAGSWYGDVDITSGNKDIIDYLRGVWINEVSEMAYLYKKESNALKSFISRKVDRVRLAYDRRSKDFPRQWVLVGTMNPIGDNTYNNDDSGGRRYWSVKCLKRLEVEKLRQERDQLWAEAYLVAKNGIKLCLSHEAEQIAQNEQEKRTSKDDTYTSIIKSFLNEPNRSNQRISTAVLTFNALSLTTSQVNRSIETKVGVIMKTLGYDRHRDSEGYFYKKT